MVNAPLIMQPDILSPMVFDTRIGRKILYTLHLMDSCGK